MKLFPLLITVSVISLSSAYAANAPFQVASEYHSKHGVLEITPSQNDAAKFNFNINASIEMYACEAEGTAYITERNSALNTWNATALVNTDSNFGEQYCKMEFAKDKVGKITVKTNFGCSGQCGMGAEGAMDGVYKQ
ncbi:hypothetical protein J6836_08515 [Providencia sp. R33]|uniref:hypothetical protein n=1 Tax=Providencia sp. R33 TaxID=2828763 RepID=UPI001C5B66CC|nr:hypothetical protein [Providencia sp. R33]QXX84401.1 hypothetical protein J6836_08515 [Providencia sp. R33]